MQTNYEIEKTVKAAAYIAVGLGILNILIVMALGIIILKGTV